MQLEEGFAQLDAEICKSMTRFCRDSYLAQDAVQHAFMQSLNHRKMLEAMPYKAFRAWLYSTARNYLLDQKRRTAKWVYQQEENRPASGPGFETGVIDRAMLQSCMDKLDGDSKAIVAMRYYQGLNSTEIGEQLELSPSTVRSKLRKAMQVMREELEEQI